MTNITFAHNPRHIGGSYVNDWTRKCPICHKHFTVLQLAQNNNKTPCCGVRILA
jgi:rRNA maturation endonuclease Nob1